MSVRVVILAGGRGTRLAEETEAIPKPMVEIGSRPILWHIMKHYASYNFKEFIIALGYKGEVIKRYFRDYYTLNSDMTVSLVEGQIEVHNRSREDWNVHLIDTGLESSTGGRVKRLASWLKDETFMVTYGDGVSDVDLEALLRFHRSHGKIATVTAVRPSSRFGGLIFNEENLVNQFIEKPQIGEGWINGGFLVFEPAVLDYLEGDQASLEREGLERLAEEGELLAYRHEGFWQCMDTLRDVRILESLWQSGQAAWKVWK